MAAPSLPLLLFFTSPRSGPARRMDSLLAQLARKERTRVRISRIDAEASPEIAGRLGMCRIPTRVLVTDGGPVARLEDRVSAPEITRMLDGHLPRKDERAAAA